MPFNSTCEALGVVLDLSESSSALAKVYNTQSRVQKSRQKSSVFWTRVGSLRWKHKNYVAGCSLLTPKSLGALKEVYSCVEGICH